MHMALASFRDEILTSIARLEFQLRDIPQRNGTHNNYCNTKYGYFNNATNVSDSQRNDTFWNDDNSKDTAHKEEMERRIRALEASIQMLLENQNRQPAVSKASSITTTIEDDLLNMQAPADTRNIIVKSHSGTPALAAAVAAANALTPLDIGSTPLAHAVVVENTVLVEDETEADEEGEEVEGDEEVEGEEVDDDEEVEGEEEADVEDDEEASVVEEEDDAPALTRMVLNNQVYFLDEENTAYQETEDGYEEVGKFNPVTKRVEVSIEQEEQEEQEEAEEEEEGIEVEEFIYKGKVYARDTENNVYLDGEQVGTWNGKKIVPLT